MRNWFKDEDQITTSLDIALPHGRALALCREFPYARVHLETLKFAPNAARAAFLTTSYAYHALEKWQVTKRLGRLFNIGYLTRDALRLADNRPADI